MAIDICFVTDPLVTTKGAVGPALLLAKEFCKSGYQVGLVTSRFDPRVKNEIEAKNIRLKHIGSNYSFIQSFPTVDAWARCLIKHKKADRTDLSGFVVNTSSCIIAEAQVYYAQGPMTRALDDIVNYTPAFYGNPYRLLRSTLILLEQRLIQEFQNSSLLFVANSEFCARMYEEFGAEVQAVINPPLDCLFFQPTTTKPDADYVLTHMGVYGKEGNLQVIKAIADAGVKIKIFGKISHMSKRLAIHSNISMLGEVSDTKLVDLYSNASYTLFAFNHEPFGYIPVESMACGTPVLTYDWQGPSETVTNQETGWLAKNDEELKRLACNLWSDGYSAQMRVKSRKKAMTFDSREIFKKWVKVLNQIV